MDKRETTINFIAQRFGLAMRGPMPIEIATSRHRGFPQLLKDLGFRCGVEVGVESGVYSEELCRAIPGLELFSVDAWAAYPGYRDHVSQPQLEEFYAKTIERLGPYDAKVIREWSTEAAKNFQDGCLDFVYIDANHEFEFVTADIAAWAPKVRPGGILAGHDYRRVRNGANLVHVKDVVNAWTYAHGISPWFVMTRDKSPSWMWVC